MRSLTQQERSIIAEVELDTQRSAQEVAKNLRIKAYTVQHVLRRLRERGFLKPKPFVDIARLGKIDVGVFFSLGLGQLKERDLFLKKVQAAPQVSFLQSLSGDYHYLTVLHYHQINEVRAFLRDLSQWSQGAVISKAVIPRVRYRQYRRKYMTGVRKQESYLEALCAAEPVSIAPEELALLRHLGKGGVDSIRQAARDLRIPYSSADYRYQQLVKKQVLRGWYYELDEEVLQSQCFKLLVSCKHITPDFEEKIETFCRFHPNITYLLETLGEWDLEIGLECSLAAEVMQTVAQLYESFPTAIASIRSIGELQTLKFTMFPGLG